VSATIELGATQRKDSEQVVLDLHLPVSVDAIVAITHALGRLDRDAVIRTDAPDGVARLVLTLDMRAVRRASRRRATRGDAA
jgi:hypothetical protein